MHPLTGRSLPVWVADYVLGGYGSGAIMAVPAHDSRDHAFASAFGLPVVRVVAPPGSTGDGGDELPFTGETRAGEAGLAGCCRCVAGGQRAAWPGLLWSLGRAGGRWRVQCSMGAQPSGSGEAAPLELQ